MNKIIYILLLGILVLNSCREDFLDKYPLDEIADQSYWKKANDLKLYVNQYYTLFPGYSVGSYNAGIYAIDNNSDNLLPENHNPQLGGTWTLPADGAGWTTKKDSWGGIRSINHFFKYYKNCEDDLVLYEAYLGEAQFFKAYMYFNMLKKFGDLPWYNEPLETNSEELYAARLPRNQVVDSILVLLDGAIDNLPLKSDAENLRLNKESALLLKARVALYEGTWEKYHKGTAFAAADVDPSKYMTTAANTAYELMELGTASIYKESNTDFSTNYLNNFNQIDYSNNPEVLLWKKFDKELGMGHNAGNGESGEQTGLSKSLVDCYLCSDGKPIYMSDLYEGDADYITETNNRDPRLSQTMWLPGMITVIRDGEIIYFQNPLLLVTEKPNTTGYQKRKGANYDGSLSGGHFQSDQGSIIFRYAEALLIYAEAKAELDDISQNELDITINVLRDRVDMPHMVLSEINTWNDPNWDFPELSPVINEIRRERRVELACEGYRKDDLFRWKAHHLISGIQPRGAKFVQELYPDTDASKVNVDANGYIVPYLVALPNGWGFDPNRDYLSPIPSNELVLNENLKPNNPGW
ncbi:RagB/SusD family nutrient uptake outer membrane protein [Carboxylicivirga marina]|uniref:RagB/SusD family nutrient uptake outer membrane protein n=1 Tax=Carboxylicivirga marina TaxID=2800988 RepID=UPI0025978F84|nr:RagB/SusD family nutrient uptake outer membrane protein [uncultured Carboxylicivirga sp.]